MVVVVVCNVSILDGAVSFACYSLSTSSRFVNNFGVSFLR